MHGCQQASTGYERERDIISITLLPRMVDTAFADIDIFLFIYRSICATRTPSLTDRVAIL